MNAIATDKGGCSDGIHSKRRSFPLKVTSHTYSLSHQKRISAVELLCISSLPSGLPRRAPSRSLRLAVVQPEPSFLSVSLDSAHSERPNARLVLIRSENQSWAEAPGWTRKTHIVVTAYLSADAIECLRANAPRMTL